MLTLLAPAKNFETAQAAIQAGADAVYIGASSFGARQAAGNSLDDIARLVQYARPYGVQVLVTLNTLLRPDEVQPAVRLAWQLYEAGVDALIIGTRGSVAINGDAIKASAGALHSLPICKVENLQNALRYLQESGLRIVAATEHTERNYTEVDMTVPTCIVMGSEEKGIYEENLKLCTDQVRLPMTGVIESLNVSVAAGVFIYEAVRQRSCK